jgi:hypothetical protein
MSHGEGVGASAVMGGQLFREAPAVTVGARCDFVAGIDVDGFDSCGGPGEPVTARPLPDVTRPAAVAPGLEAQPAMGAAGRLPPDDFGVAPV